MTIRDFLRVMRAHWLIVMVTTVVAIVGAVAVTWLTTPLYQASTRLFIATSAITGGDANEIYSGTLSAQQRVLSYTKLLTGQTLAQRTVDKLHLDMSAEALRDEVKASAPTDTFLIDVSVRNPSPTQARDIANALSDEFVVLIGELETPPEGGRPDARVVVEQHASLPVKPVIPSKTRNLALGLAVGLLAGIALAVTRDRLDNTVKNRQVLEDTTGVGLVANIPLDKDCRKDPAISFADNYAPIAEAFREFRTNLQFLDVDDPPRLILVTSSLPGEGKSTTAINIALALAEAEHNVVLVDGDIRRPKLADYLDLIGSVGLSTVLAGRASLQEVLQKTRFPGLTVLTSGTLPPNPSELLGSLAAKKLFSELRGSFDYVIVDSSPLLAVTDAAILAAEADAVLLIAKFGKTKREQLAHAVGNVQNVGGRLLGAVFTMTPARGNAYYDYSYAPAEGTRRQSRRDLRDGSPSPTTSPARKEVERSTRRRHG